MKKTLFVVFALAVLVACEPSKEKKALALVESAIKPELFHPDSYKSTYISIDSAFVNVAFDQSALKLVDDIISVSSKMSEMTDKIERAERKMAIWGGPYMSSLGRSEYNSAKKEKEEQEQLLERARNKFFDLFNEIKEKDAALHKGEFCGWIIYNKFTSLNEAGTSSLPSEYMFIADKDLTTCFGYEKEVFDTYRLLTSMIVESEDIEEFVEKCQDYSLTE